MDESSNESPQYSYQYRVILVVGGDEPYTKDQLREIINENCLHHTDNAPFDIYIDEIQTEEEIFGH